MSTLSGTCWHPSASQRDVLPGFAALTCTLGDTEHPSLQPGLLVRGSQGPAWLPTAAVDGGGQHALGQPLPSPAGLDGCVADYREGGWWASDYNPWQNVLGFLVSISQLDSSVSRDNILQDFSLLNDLTSWPNICLVGYNRFGRVKRTWVYRGCVCVHVTGVGLPPRAR